MPELPEVETIRRGLAKHIADKVIRTIEVRDRKPVKTPLSQFLKTLKGNAVVDISRIGKLLIFTLKKGGYLLVHLKMTGQLIYQKGKRLVGGGHPQPPIAPEGLPTKYTWIIFHYADGSLLHFNDMRKFGYIKLVDQQHRDSVLAAYGIEPLTPRFTARRLADIVDRRMAPIKSVLMNQELIAGIGNIYADEICFDAGIRPDRKTNSLSYREIKRLFASIKRVLKKAIAEGGTTFRDFVTSGGTKGKFVKFLKVYGRAKQNCLVCGRPLSSKKIGGRTSRFCSHCQA